MEGLWCGGPSVHPSDVLFLARLIHAIIVMREIRENDVHLLRRLFRLFVCGSPSSPQSVSRPYLAIQLSAARGQILEWAARGDMLCYTASSSSVQVDTKIMTTF